MVAHMSRQEVQTTAVMPGVVGASGEHLVQALAVCAGSLTACCSAEEQQGGGGGDSKLWDKDFWYWGQLQLGVRALMVLR